MHGLSKKAIELAINTSVFCFVPTEQFGGVEASLSALHFLSSLFSLFLCSSLMAALVVLFVGLVALVGSVSSAKFDELFQPSWAMDHFVYEGELLKLKLDNSSGTFTTIH